jgi:peptidoglycan biosynthesis protein MviN/MurJ (putative lipid II flippase)
VVIRRGGPADPADLGDELVTAEGEPEPASDLALGLTTRPSIGKAALLIGGLTIIARILGLARTVIFAGTVRSSCLSAAYVTANMVPNVIYDFVLGGALTAIVVPVLAGPAHRAVADARSRAEVSSISSALLTWTVIILGPVSLVLALASRPVISLLMPSSPAALVASGPVCSRQSLMPIASTMLIAFAPQILLYGLAVVLYGILQAHRKFTAPALAPILSSIVVIGAYVLFVPLGGRYTTHVRGLPLDAELTLAIGTTLGVSALLLTAAVPAWRLRLRWRPALRFPEGIARRATSLAGVGVAALVAQDAAVLVVTRLANGYGQATNGVAVTVYSYSWQVFVSVYAVLAIPFAISAFPVLAARQGAEFDDAAASATRSTALASWLGAGLLAAVAGPMAHAFPGMQGAVRQFALALAVFAPGLVGYGLTACLSRVLLADGRNRMAAFGLVVGWVLVIGVDLAVIPLVHPDRVVPVLGLANTIGMTVSGAALLIAVRVGRGAPALDGVWRALSAGLAGAACGALIGYSLTRLVRVDGEWQNAGMVLLSGASALVVFGIVVAVLDGGDLRHALSRFRRRAVP